MANPINYLVYIILGLAPSLAWLSFYLRKDIHPEPKRKVLEIFFWGMVAAISAAGVEILILSILTDLSLSTDFVQILYIFLGIALAEELLKYLVVKFRVFRSPEFDEPIDSMVYMIIAALGFAGLENILLFFSENLQFLETLLISGLRFVGATFLHALCSGLLGFFLALYFCEGKKKKIIPLSGLGLAVLLHGAYNFSIMRIEGNSKFIIPILILAGLAGFISWGFKKLKKMRGICKLK